MLQFIAMKSQNVETLLAIKEQKPIVVTGSLSANIASYSVSGIDSRSSPFQYGLSGRVNFKIYGLDIPIYAAIRDNSFNYGGSINRLRIDPSYKWVKLHIGDTYMKFNPYTLAGRTVRGVGIELTPGKFRFKALHGAIEDFRSYQDTLTLGTTFQPTYSRKTTAISVGIGSRNTYVDLYAVTTNDRVDSLGGEKVIDGLTRMANTVLGSSIKIQVMKSLTVSTNFGYSLSTDNLDAIGTNQTLGSNGLTENLIEANISSYRSYAGDVAINYNNRYFSVNGKIRYIQPYFQPLTVAFINTDIVNYTVGGSFGLFKRRVLVSGSIGIQENNLSGSKLSTAKQLILNTNASINLAKGLNANIRFNNFSQNYEARIVQINDLYTYAIDNNTATANLNYSKKINDYLYRVGVRIGQSNFVTIDETENVITEFSNVFSALNFGLTDKDSGWRASTNLDYRTYDRENAKNTNYGGRLQVSKSLLDKLLVIKGATSYHFNDLNDRRDATIWRNNFSVSYKLNDVSTIGGNLSHIQRNSILKSDFTELRILFNYNHRF